MRFKEKEKMIEEIRSKMKMTMIKKGMGSCSIENTETIITILMSIRDLDLWLF